MGQALPIRSASKSGGGRCPVCRAPTDPAVLPFCSVRCADVDLSRWLSGVYAIPVTGDDDDEDGDKGSGSEPRGSGEQRG